MKKTELKIIKTDREYEALLGWVDEQFDLQVVKETGVGEKLQVALLLIKQYEDINHPHSLSISY